MDGSDAARTKATQLNESTGYSGLSSRKSGG